MLYSCGLRTAAGARQIVPRFVQCLDVLPLTASGPRMCAHSAPLLALLCHTCHRAQGPTPDRRVLTTTLHSVSRGASRLRGQLPRGLQHPVERRQLQLLSMLLCSVGRYLRKT
eukprot:scaffold17295_cov120-Isochrysis_galbana.AAC.3